MSDSRVEHINATLSELVDLMQLITKSYPEVPAILYKISLEKGESLCEELRALNTVKETVPQSHAETVLAESDEASPHMVEIVVNESLAETAASDDEPREGNTSVTMPETEKVADKKVSMPFSWDTTEEEFCLFDRIPEMKTTVDETPAVAEGGAATDNKLDSEEKAPAESVAEAPVTESEREEEVPLCESNPEVENSDAEPLSQEPAAEASIEKRQEQESVAEASTEVPLEQKEAEMPHDEVSTVVTAELIESEEPVAPAEKKTPLYRELQKMMSINDRFLFRRELFDNDGELMGKTIDELNEITSYEESLAYLHNHFNWDFESETVDLLRSLLQHRFEL